MRSINASTLVELQATEMRIFLLVDKVIDGEHIRLTNCDVPITYDGNLYDSRRLSLDDLKYSSRYLTDTARISVDNIDLVFTDLYVESDVQDSPTTIYLVAVSNLAKVIGEPIMLFPGKVDDWILDEESLDETLRSRVGRGDVCTLKRYTAACPWSVFKGTECGYTGSESWCDRTYARCEALSNTANFGGSRWLPSLATKEIWWGRVKNL